MRSQCSMGQPLPRHSLGGVLMVSPFTHGQSYAEGATQGKAWNVAVGGLGKMKIVVFGDQQRVGALHDGAVIDLNRASERLPSQLDAFIAAGQAALDEAQQAIERAMAAGPDSGLLVPLAQTQLHAPLPRRRIACVGGNYAAHLMGMEAGRAVEGEVTLESITQRTRANGQWGFWKVADKVAGPDDDIPYPKRAQYFDYEGEAAIIIGRRIKDASAGQLRDCVWGVTLLNDWSIR